MPILRDENGQPLVDESGQFLYDEAGGDAPAAAQAAELNALQALLPPGQAWTRQAGTHMTRLLGGLAVEFGRIHERVVDLLAEMDHRTATELLRRYETVWGLPGPCQGAAETLALRRAALDARIVSLGGQRPGYFVALAAAIGFTVTVEENIGGDPTVWRIRAPETTVRWARAGSSVAGERIRSWGNDLLECTIEQVNPAHLTVLFAYGEPA